MRLKELINFIVMKKLLLLLLFVPLLSFGQNDFRKMNWGESKEALKEKYPDVEFIPVFQSGADFLTHFDTVLGFTASVNYLFIDNKLVGGIYTFSPMAFVQTGDDKLKEYNSVSERLNDKYELKREDTWYKDGYKNLPDMLGFAIDMGEVDLSEMGFKDKDSLVVIAHALNKDAHTLTFIHKDGALALDKSMDDDI